MTVAAADPGHYFPALNEHPEDVGYPAPAPAGTGQCRCGAAPDQFHADPCPQREDDTRRLAALAASLTPPF